MRIIKDTAIYMAGSVANQATAFLVLPVLTRYLTPAEYGQAALFTTLVTFLAPFVGMSLNTHISRNFFKVDQAEMARIGSNILRAVLFNFCVVLALCALLGHWSAAYLGMPWVWTLLGAGVALGSAWIAQCLAFLRVKGRALQFGAFEFTSAVTNFGLSLFFVALWHWGWQGRSAGFALSELAMGCAGLLLVARMGYLRSRFDLVLTRALYRISLPLVPHMLAGQITTMSSRIFLNNMISTQSVGLYAVGYTLGSLLNLPIQAFSNAWTPWVYKKLSLRDERSNRQIVRVVYAVAAGLLLVWLGLVAATPLLLRVATTAAYFGAAAYVTWVALSLVFQGIYMLLVPVLVEEARTDALAIFTGVVAVLSLVLNYALIRQFGAIGAAYTLAICAAVKMALVFWWVNRVRPMPWLSAILFRST